MGHIETPRREHNLSPRLAADEGRPGGVADERRWLLQGRRGDLRCAGAVVISSWSSGSKVADRLSDEVHWLRQCAAWLTRSPPATCQLSTATRARESRWQDTVAVCDHLVDNGSGPGVARKGGDQRVRPQLLGDLQELQGTAVVAGPHLGHEQ